ncbi:MAG: aminomethyl-transferring glycine dehydrogenase subunit GcvPA, partial [Spirochaetes bacterium]|nr:aminomethyl-transferring glycine dehydrogenase subunit GcvPA [Spirochaetota bacterium]
EGAAQNDSAPTLESLQYQNEFVDRHIGPGEAQIQEMLKTLSVDSLQQLAANTVPESIALNSPLALAEPLTENSALSRLKAIAARNRQTKSFIGLGYYDTHTPNVILRNVLENPGWYTAYTPYQPEISQGTLQAIFEYQSYITTLTGMDVSNASMYDGATALAEAVIMAHKITGKKKILLDKYTHPDYIKVLKTYLHPLKIEIEIFNSNPYSFDIENFKNIWNADYACFIISSPNYFGSIIDFSEVSHIIHSDKRILIQNITEALSLSILKSPGEYDVDIACGEAQSFGIPLSFGGPYLGFIACKKQYLRKMPGRIIGQTNDRDGNIAYVLTLSAREQHIRREGATSNICTNHSLCALRAVVYLSILGANGLKECGLKNIENAHLLHSEISNLNNFDIIKNQVFFNEFVVNTRIDYLKIKKLLEKENILSFFPLKEFDENSINSYMVCATEMNTKKQIRHLIDILGSIS